MEKNIEINKIEFKKEKNQRNIKLIILIILIIIVIVTSFKSGERFFEIKNSSFDKAYSKVDSNVAKWCFSVKIVY